MVNLLSRSRIRNLNLLARSPRSTRRLRACCAVQAPVGWVVTPRTYTARVSIHHEHDVQAPEEDGVHVQEIARQDAGRLGPQELPRRRRPPRCGAETGGGQDPADRPLSHPVPQAQRTRIRPPCAWDLSPLLYQMQDRSLRLSDGPGRGQGHRVLESLSGVATLYAASVGAESAAAHRPGEHHRITRQQGDQ
jgi:hypothetical protein